MTNLYSYLNNSFYTVTLGAGNYQAVLQTTASTVIDAKAGLAGVIGDSLTASPPTVYGYLSFTNRGQVIGGAGGGAGVDLTVTSVLTNAVGGLIQGGAGSDAGTIGGIGVNLAAAPPTIGGSPAYSQNDGSIVGGVGGAGAAGGIGLNLSNGAAFENVYTIAGGAGGAPSSGAGGAGGTGATVAAGTTLINTSTSGGIGNLVGGAGGAGTTVGGAGGTGVELAANAAFTNAGSIEGGVGGAGPAGGAGGIGVTAAAGATFDNSALGASASNGTSNTYTAGTITGGAGYSAQGNTGSGGAGGAGVSMDAATVTNHGAITGGAGGVGYNPTFGGTPPAQSSGAGGTGVTATGAGSLTNYGTITGGIGGDGVAVQTSALGVVITGNGGLGVDLGSSATTLINEASAIITGGASGSAPGTGLDATGGIGLAFSDAAVSNFGTIEGGAGLLGGAGVSIDGGTIENVFGRIQGGNGVTGGDGLIAQTASPSTYDITNTAGYIEGGSGSSASGTGVELLSGWLANAGYIVGGNSSGSGSGGIGLYMAAGARANNALTSNSQGQNIAGSITGGEGDLTSSGGVGLQLATGAAATFSAGTISGGAGGTSGGAGGAGVVMGASSSFIGANPQLTVSGGSGGADTGGTGGAGGAGIALATGGVVDDNGAAITGGAGGSGSIGGAGGVGVYLNDGGVLITSGTISGGAGGTGTTSNGVRGDAVEFGNHSGVLLIDPGAVFNGAVVGNGVSDSLQLSGTGTSALTGFGTQFTGFDTLQFNTGAAWTVDTTAAGISSANLSGNGIVGFTTSDTIDVTNLAFTAGETDSLNFGVLTISEGGTTLLSAPVYGSFTGYHFALSSDGSAGTDITLVPNTQTGYINDTVDKTVVPGNVYYARTLGIGPSGVVQPASGVGIDASGGGDVITNKGSITGGASAAGVDLSGGTLTNAGTIAGGSGADAIDFGGAAATLIVDPGAVFSGQVAANASVDDTLELAGTSASTLTGWGTQFTGFSTLDFASGSTWTVDASTSALANNPTIQGFAIGDTLDLTDLSAAGATDSFNTSTDVLTVTSGDTSVNLHFDSAFSGDQFVLTPAGNGTDLALAPVSLTDTISTTVHQTVFLNSAQYFSPLTVTSTGAVAPVVDGASGVVTDSLNVSLTNDGSITGATGGVSLSTVINGGIGVDVESAGATVTNSGHIAGGNSGEPTYPAYGGVGVNLNAAGSTLVNTATGTITGGDNTGYLTGYEGIGGAGVDLSAGTVTNTGHITGGGGETPQSIGGTGVMLLGASTTLTNTGAGVIAGGEGGIGAAGHTQGGGEGGLGVLVALAGDTLTNAASITGGAGGTGSDGGGGGQGGTGLSLGGVLGLAGDASSTLSNTATITGGAGGNGGSGGGGGTGVNIGHAGGALENSGSITGGAAGTSSAAIGSAGGTGAYLRGGTLTNTGTITGGAGGASTDGKAGGNGGVGVSIVNQGATLVTSGTISGGAAGGPGGAAGYSILFNDTHGATLIVDPGAVFNGLIGGFGLGGSTIDIANLAPSAVAAAFMSSSETLSILDGGTMLNMSFATTGDFSFTSLNEHVVFSSDGHGGTDLNVAPNGNSSITGTVTTPVTLGSGGYAAGVTITSSGVVAPTTSGATAVSIGPFDTLTNEGSVTGGAGASGGNGGVGVYLNGGTLVTAGSISGGAAGTGGAAGDAVKFGTYASTLVVDPGAVFSGQVAANTAVNDTLQLGGTAASTLTGLGTQLTGFSTLDFASGAQWSVDATTAAFSNDPAITGFGLGDQLDITNLAPGATDSFDTSTHVLTLTDGGTTLTLKFDSAFSGEQFVLTPDSGGTGTDIALSNVAPVGTISKTVTSTVVLGSAAYPSPLTVSSTGAIQSTLATAAVVTAATGASLTNDGSITGGSSGYIIINGNTVHGGDGVDLESTGAALINNNAIAGGLLQFANVASVGGVGVNLSAAATTLDNSATGTITGGNTGSESGYFPLPGNGGLGGIGVELSAGAVTNSGHIAGGSGGTASGNGGVGVALIASGTTLTNEGSGTITGGAGSNKQDDLGNGGAGVNLSGGTVTNLGSIDGGAGGNSPVVIGANALHLYNGGSGGAGVDLGSGTLTSSGHVTGGTGGVGYVGGAGGAGLTLTGGYFDNTGTIAGGTGGAGSTAANGRGGLGGAGAYVDGGTLMTSGTISAGSGGTGDGAGASGDAVSFGPAGGTLAVASGAVFHGAIGGFAIGDTVDITNLTPTQVAGHFDSGTDTLTTPSDGTLLFAGSFTGEHFVFSPDAGNGTDMTLVACYCRGTRILAEAGEVAIETLKIGDRLKTTSGQLRAIRWIGRRHYSLLEAAGNRAVLPIVIRAGALGDDVPRRDLWVSPEHALYVDGMLIPAQALLNGLSIVQDEVLDEVTYFHVELDSHDVIYAEGAPSESYVDDDNREMFDNAWEYAHWYPGAIRQPAQFCAPRVEEGEELEMVRRRLAAHTWTERPVPRGGALTRVSGFSICT